MIRNHKISFCFVVMNRLYQLKQTLSVNIRDNESYPFIEFIILDYNSSDGLGDWIAGNFFNYIESKKLVYYRTNEPNQFNHSHSKNIVFKLATGDIVCNINADHFTGRNFAQYVNKQFSDCSEIVLTPIDFHRSNKNFRPAKDVFGKVCVKKTDFLRVRGFDERMTGYGFEDWDFINRLEFANVKRVLIEEPSFLRFIAHEEERYSIDLQLLANAYVNYIDPSTSEVILLKKNGTYERGILIDHKTIDSGNFRLAYQARQYLFEYSLKSEWENGIWKENSEFIEFISVGGNKLKLVKHDMSGMNVLQSADTDILFYQITANKVLNALLDFKYSIENRSKLESNFKAKRIVANKSCFGEANVFKNFDVSNRICV